jgi:uncharacterized protein GlcG (DUF336 family)
MSNIIHHKGWLATACALGLIFAVAFTAVSNRATARAQDGGRTDHNNMIPTITLAEAKRVIAAAEKKAVDMNKKYNIAIVDAGGNLVAFHRMDGAWLGSIELAINKAYTSRVFDISTKDLNSYSQPGAQFYGIQTQPRIVVFAGGIPLKRNGQVVGAVGASGGMGAEDQSVAEAGAAAF